ncbi:hypothetical protein [Cellulomonas endophytica]|uniref:hypothetical protein n=1 Tax=Cellulomonas endophytica TaxID=2494735 RepID=UPI001010F34D|nr:hypothetical protein [Cellulomonas endophytica]
MTSGVVDATGELGRSGMGASPLTAEDRARCRAAWAALLAYGPRAVAVGTSALALLGVHGLPPTIVGQVALPAGDHRRPRGGLATRHLPGVPTVRVGTARVASPVHATAQALPHLDRRHGVAVLDSALQRRLLVETDLAAVDALLRGRRGAAAARPLLALADGRSQSPLESWARLDLTDAGLPPDELQVPVRTADGRTVARGDLGWRLPGGRWLVAEIDGATVHGTPEAVFADRRRQNAVVATGTVDLLRFTAHDLGPRGRLVTTIGTHLAAAGRRARTTGTGS